MTDQMTGHGTAGHENAGHETTGHKRARYETGSEANVRGRIDLVDLAFLFCSQHYILWYEKCED